MEKRVAMNYEFGMSPMYLTYFQAAISPSCEFTIRMMMIILMTRPILWVLGFENSAWYTLTDCSACFQQVSHSGMMMMMGFGWFRSTIKKSELKLTERVTQSFFRPPSVLREV